jgi:dTDP-4-dehydrorhamnose reductase
MNNKMAVEERWLVTGANGQLGRAVVALAPLHGINAIGLNHAELDITDSDAVKRMLDHMQPKVVLNCAAFTAVDRCESEYEAAWHVNANGPAVLAAACKSGPLLVQVSTDYVFDGQTNRTLNEDARPAPVCVYGKTKFAGELGVAAAGGEHLIVRTQWLFGSGPNFVRTVLRAAAQPRRQLRVVDDQYGRPTSTTALARAIFRAVEVGARGRLHLACEGVASWNEFAQAIVDKGVKRGLNQHMDVIAISTQELSRPAERPEWGVLDLTYARAELGIVLPHWRDALDGYIDSGGFQGD